MLYKYGKRRRDFWEVFLYLFIYLVSLAFYILGTSMIKQLFHSRLLDMRYFKKLSATRLAGYLLAHIQRAPVEMQS